MTLVLCRRRHDSHLELTVLLLKVFIFVGITVRKLIYLDAVLLDLFADL